MLLHNDLIELFCCVLLHSLCNVIFSLELFSAKIKETI